MRKLLTKQRKLVRFYWSDPTEMEQSMASGEVVMAWGYNQSLVSLKRQGLPVAFMTPKEGLFAWGSGFIMHKDVEDEQAAYDYIDAWIRTRIRGLADRQLRLRQLEPQGLRSCRVRTAR